MPHGLELDHLPPAVQLLVRELRPGADLHKQLKRLLPELRRQSEWTLENVETVYGERPSSTSALCINPSAGLDPFSIHGKCSDPPCRVANADQIARTVGLYADFAYVGDPFTDQFVFTERWTANDEERLVGNLVIFLRLLPLFEANVFRFKSNFSAACKNCLSVMRSQVEQVTQRALADMRPKLTAERMNDLLVLHTDDSFGMPLAWRMGIKPSMQRELDRGANPLDVAITAFTPTLANHVHETVFNMATAPRGTVTFSNSRIALQAAREFDSAVRGNTEVWEADRSTKLPWVADLSSHEVVCLREEAREALPRFRERMARTLTNEEPAEAKKVVHDLREEAAEVEAELKALDGKGESRFRTLSGLLGMTISVYGFAGEFLATGAALTGLATLLGLLHTGEHKQRQEEKKLTTRPGYLLVKAKELARHAKQ